MSWTEKWSARAPWVLSVLRISTGLQFLEHGTQKLIGFPPVQGPPHAPILSLLGMSGYLEFFGGVLIVLGFFTRPVAFLLSGEMAVGYFAVHAPHGLYPMANGGDTAMLFTFVFFYMAFAGGGPFSLDVVLARRSPLSANSGA